MESIGVGGARAGSCGFHKYNFKYIFGILTSKYKIELKIPEIFPIWIVKNVFKANHMNTHTGDRPHKCRFCGKGFKDYSSLRTHHQSHQDIRPYQCNTCEKAYRRPDDLKKHELTHLGIKPHVCSFCAKGFR